MLGILTLAMGFVVGSAHATPNPAFVGPPAERLVMSPFEPDFVVEPRRPHWWRTPLRASEPWKYSVEHLGLRGYRGSLDSEVGWRSTMGVPLLTLTFGIAQGSPP